MDLTIVLFIINGLMGVIMFFIANAVNSTKDKFRDLQEQQDTLRDKSLPKEDFKEFKRELWDRLDQLLKTRNQHP